MKVQRLTRADYRRMRWRNDGGWTTEIVREAAAEGADDFDWRVSIAEIESSGGFSRFPGCDRTLLLIDGPGIELRVDGQPPALLDRRGQAFRFDGDRESHGRLLDGPTRDFNVITRRAATRHQAWLRPLVGPMAIFPEPGVTWLVHVLSGEAAEQHRPGGAVAGPGDTLRLERGDDARHVVLSGAGELVLVRIDRVD
jgi:environmental stress-induced protein Ves